MLNISKIVKLSTIILALFSINLFSCDKEQSFHSSIWVDQGKYILPESGATFFIPEGSAAVIGKNAQVLFENVLINKMEGAFNIPSTVDLVEAIIVSGLSNEELEKFYLLSFSENTGLEEDLGEKAALTAIIRVPDDMIPQKDVFKESMEQFMDMQPLKYPNEDKKKLILVSSNFDDQDKTEQATKMAVIFGENSILHILWGGEEHANNRSMFYELITSIQFP